MAYYQVDMAYLYIMPDVAESEDFSMLRRGKSVWKYFFKLVLSESPDSH